MRTLSRAFLTRHLHTRRPLAYPIDQGVGTFLPPPALRAVAQDYQQGLLDRLQEEVRGTELETKTVAQTVIATAPDRSRTLAFNYASQALNNSFFLDHIKPPPTPETSTPAELDAYTTHNNTHESHLSHTLLATLRHQHGSLAQLKSTFAAGALGMAGSGWLWLVTDAEGATAVVPTFAAGTLLVRARMQLVPQEGQWDVVGELRKVPGTGTGEIEVDAGPAAEAAAAAAASNRTTATPPTSPTSGLARDAPPLDPHAQTRSFTSGRAAYSDPLLGASASSLFGPTTTAPSNASTSTSASASNTRPTYAYSHSADQADAEALATHGSLRSAKLGEWVYPLLCVSVHEHAWMSAGLGVWGREEYLRRFWSVVDWGKVSSAFDWWVGRRKL